MAKFNLTKPFKNKMQGYKKYEDWLKINFYPEFCSYCWISNRATTIDHYKPKEHFLEFIDDPDNLTLACSKCNLKKGDYHPEAMERRNYLKQDHLIFNCRKENLGSLIKVKEDGSLEGKEKSRFNFNSFIFELEHPHKIEYRKYIISKVNSLIKCKELLQSIKKNDPKYQSVINLYNNFLKQITPHYLFLHILDIKAPIKIRKVLKEDIGKRIKQHKKS